MNTPTVGRIVHFYPTAAELPGGGAAGPWAAIICHVHSEHCVNLVVFDKNGKSSAKTSVRLQPPGEVVTVGECRWPDIKKHSEAPRQESRPKKA